MGVQSLLCYHKKGNLRVYKMYLTHKQTSPSPTNHFDEIFKNKRTLTLQKHVTTICKSLYGYNQAFKILQNSHLKYWGLHVQTI
jgi:hypothetical protein